jgi:FkbM family methyltransferase
MDRADTASPSATAETADRFRHRVGIFRSSRTAKLARAPGRLLYSGMAVAACRVFKTSLARRARTFWGDSMRVVLPEPGSVALLRYGFVDEGLTSIVLRLVKPGMTFFDVGAHYGYFSLLAAYLVGSSGHVHAFDPSPHAFGVLADNTSGKPNVTINNIALYSQAATLSLMDFGIEFSEFNSLAGGRLGAETRGRLKPKQISVKADSLDNYCRARDAAPDFIKIDAEGAEYPILQGMSDLLRTRRPLLTMEVGTDVKDSEGGHADCTRLLLDAGYRPYSWHAGAIVPHVPQAQYVHDNLLFAPAERNVAE